MRGAHRPMEGEHVDTVWPAQKHDASTGCRPDPTHPSSIPSFLMSDDTEDFTVRALRHEHLRRLLDSYRQSLSDPQRGSIRRQDSGPFFCRDRVPATGAGLPAAGSTAAPRGPAWHSDTKCSPKWAAEHAPVTPLPDNGIALRQDSLRVPAPYLFRYNRPRSSEFFGQCRLTPTGGGVTNEFIEIDLSRSCTNRLAWYRTVLRCAELRAESFQSGRGFDNPASDSGQALDGV